MDQVSAGSCVTSFEWGLNYCGDVFLKRAEGWGDKWGMW